MNLINTEFRQIYDRMDVICAKTDDDTYVEANKLWHLAKSFSINPPDLMDEVERLHKEATK